MVFLIRIFDIENFLLVVFADNLEVGRQLETGDFVVIFFYNMKKLRLIKTIKSSFERELLSPNRPARIQPPRPKY